jgi:hypothetical protein
MTQVMLCLQQVLQYCRQYGRLNLMAAQQCCCLGMLLPSTCLLYARHNELIMFECIFVAFDKCGFCFVVLYGLALNGRAEVFFLAASRHCFRPNMCSTHLAGLCNTNLMHTCYARLAVFVVCRLIATVGAHALQQASAASCQYASTPLTLCRYLTHVLICRVHIMFPAVCRPMATVGAHATQQADAASHMCAFHTPYIMPLIDTHAHLPCAHYAFLLSAD